MNIGLLREQAKILRENAELNDALASSCVGTNELMFRGRAYANRRKAEEIEAALLKLQNDTVILYNLSVAQCGFARSLQTIP